MSDQWQVALALLPFGLIAIFLICAFVWFVRLVKFRTAVDSFVADYLPDPRDVTVPEMRPRR